MGGTICVVDDDSFVLADAVGLLEEAGFAVVGFTSGDAALAHLGRHASEVAMVFTDVQMPGVFNGIALAQVIAISWPWVKVLVTSGNTAVARGDLPAGATFLPKPWLPGDILAHIP